LRHSCGDTSIVRIVGVGRLVRDKSDRPQPSQITFRFRDLSAASAMAVRSLGPPTTMSFRLAIGH
jgi:hypothetical protein